MALSVALLAGLGAVGCGLPDGGSDRSASEVVADVANGTVAVTNVTGGHRFKGSGFIFDARNGFVLTSAETIWDVGALVVQTNDGRRLHASLKARSPCDDVAVLLLHPKPPGLSEVTIAAGKIAEVGDTVTALGYPAALRAGHRSALSSTRGTVAAAYVPGKLQPTLRRFPSLLQHQAPVASGVSGGPVIDDDGEVIGLTTQIDRAGRKTGDTSLSYAIANTRIEAMLGQLNTNRKHHTLGGWKRYHAACHHPFSEVIHRARGGFVPPRYRAGEMGMEPKSGMDHSH
jgi:S1-C subfamily serine protease